MGARANPLALIEVAKDRGQKNNAVTVFGRRAVRSRLAAYAVLYRRANKRARES